jgi:hypothetical protein
MSHEALFNNPLLLLLRFTIVCSRKKKTAARKYGELKKVRRLVAYFKTNILTVHNVLYSITLCLALTLLLSKGSHSYNNQKQEEM